LKMPIGAHFYRRAILTRKLGHTGLVSTSASLVGPCMQDYKSWYAVLRCFPPWFTSRHTHTHTDCIWPSYMKSSAQLIKMN